MRYRTEYKQAPKFLALKKYGVFRRGQNPHAKWNNFSDFLEKIAIFVTLKKITLLHSHLDFWKENTVNAKLETV